MSTLKLGLKLGCIADDSTGATDLANNLVRSGMRVVQTIGVPSAPLALPRKTTARSSRFARALSCLVPKVPEACGRPPLRPKAFARRGGLPQQHPNTSQP